MKKTTLKHEDFTVEIAETDRADVHLITINGESRKVSANNYGARFFGNIEAGLEKNDETGDLTFVMGFSNGMTYFNEICSVAVGA